MGFRKYWLCLSVLILCSCGDSVKNKLDFNTDDSINPLISFEKIASYSATQVKQSKTMTSEYGYELVASEFPLEYDIDIWRIVYSTEYFGLQLVDASAIVVLPKSKKEVSLVSVHEGSKFHSKKCPSERALKALEQTDSEGLSFAMVAASAGLGVVVLDKIGFGESSGLWQSLFIKEITGSNIENSILAAKELLDKVEVDFSGDLFLQGYSQGGYDALAASSLIFRNKDLENYPKLIAVGGFPVDIESLAKNALDTNHSLQYYDVAMIHSYAKYSGVGSDVVFADSMVAKLDTMFTGIYDCSKLQFFLTNHSVNSIYNEEFLKQFNDHLSQGGDLRMEFKVSSLFNSSWGKGAEIRIFYGGKDGLINVENMNKLKVEMTKDGALAEIIPIEGKGHVDAGLDFRIRALKWFLKYTKG